MATNIVKQTIKCQSCEVKMDVIIRDANYELDDVEISFCPVCSVGLDDLEDYDEDWEMG